MTRAGRPDLSVLILSWNTRDMLRDCLNAVRDGTTTLEMQVVVIDNASTDGSADLIAAEYPEVELQRNASNEGYANGVNAALALATGEKICLLGSDTRVSPHALPGMLGYLDAQQGVGAVAPRLVNPDGTVQRACMRFPTLKTALYWDTPLQHFFPDSNELRRYQMKDWDHHGTRPVEQPPGTCLMLPRSVVETIGPMDPRLWLFFNDVDWALRIQSAGLGIHYLDNFEVVHHLGGSTRNYADFGAEWHRNRIRFYRKHFHAAGSGLTKLVATYAALRQCVRLKKDLPFGREYWSSVGTILRTLSGILSI